MEALSGSVAARSAFVTPNDHRRARLQINCCRWRRPRLQQRGIGSRLSMPRAPRVAAFAAAPEADADDAVSEEAAQPLPLPADDPVLPKVSTTFVLERRCEYGERFVVAGDHELLGAWDPDSALPMTWTEGHVWKCGIDLPAEKDYEYKFVLTGKDVKPDWQPGPNRRFSTRESSLIVSESWEDAEVEAGAIGEKTVEVETGAEERVKAEAGADDEEDVEADGESKPEAGSSVAEELEAEVESGVTGELLSKTEPEAGVDGSLEITKAELTVDGDLETVDEVATVDTKDEAGEVAASEPVVAEAAAAVDKSDEEVTPPLTENEPATLAEGVATQLTTSGSGSGSGSSKEECSSAKSTPQAENVSSSGKVILEDSKGFKIFRFHTQEEPDNGQPSKGEEEVPFLETALASTLLKGDDDEKKTGGT